MALWDICAVLGLIVAVPIVALGLFVIWVTYGPAWECGHFMFHGVRFRFDGIAWGNILCGRMKQDPPIQEQNKAALEAERGR